MPILAGVHGLNFGPWEVLLFFVFLAIALVGPFVSIACLAINVVAIWQKPSTPSRGRHIFTVVSVLVAALPGAFLVNWGLEGFRGSPGPDPLSTWVFVITLLSAAAGCIAWLIAALRRRNAARGDSPTGSKPTI
jgi:hypothetical protein